MTKKQKKKTSLIFAFIALGLLLASIATAGERVEVKHETIQEVMRDAVMHDINKVAFFGLEVNPGLIAAFVVSGIMILFALYCRIFVIPKFETVPHGLQLVLETVVGFFNNMAKTNSEKINKFLSAYIFTAGCYIFTGTMFELFGFQVVTTHGNSVPMPAPLSDINGAIMMGVLSYLVIVSGAIIGHGPKGIIEGLKEFSLPISLTFRLFGALLSGALVTELVYYYESLNYFLPVVIGILFTVLHALIQAFVLTTLTSIFYGKVSDTSGKEHKEKKSKRIGRNKEGIDNKINIKMEENGNA